MEEEFIYVGKIVNTHGIKGEIRILSDFEYKNKVFVPKMKLYIGRKKEEVVIKTYRHHKNFEMITMEGYTDINQVLRFKGLYVYVKRIDLSLAEDEYLDQDYIGLGVYYNRELQGTIIDIRSGALGKKLFVVETLTKKVLVPFEKGLIKELNWAEKKLEFIPVVGLFE